jgi:MYXO-CTERM domain-containing protein
MRCHGLIGVLAVFAWPAVANAHIRLMYPPSRIIESAQGDPQKAGPCGAGAGIAMTNVRTQFKPGQTITVIFKETVPHPGHFRIEFDDDGDDAFKDPANATDIVDPPVLPVLKDGLFPNHTNLQLMMVDVTLPNITCKNCTLQVTQEMIAGASVTLYYHCADIELTNDASDAGAAPPPARDAGGTAPGSPGPGGSGGAAPGTGGSAGSSGSAGVAGAPAGTGGNPPTGGAPGTSGTPPAGAKPNSMVNGSIGGCAVSARPHPQAPAPWLVVVGILVARATRRRR